MYALMSFHALSDRIEHIELKSSMKGVAADQIKRARQNYSGGPGPSPCYGTAYETTTTTATGRSRKQ